MTVKELIEALSAEDPGAQVVIERQAEWRLLNIEDIGSGSVEDPGLMMNDDETVVGPFVTFSTWS